MNLSALPGFALTLLEDVVTIMNPDSTSEINVLVGSHEMNLPVNLANDTDVTVSDGATLSINGVLRLGGFTLSITELGSGTLQINGPVITGGGTVMLGGVNITSQFVVPEPHSLLLLVAGASCCGLAGQRRRRMHNLSS